MNNLLLRWHKFLELWQDISHRKSICFPWEYRQRLILSPFFLDGNMCCINHIFISWILGANSFNLAPAASHPVTLAWPCPSECSTDCICWGTGTAHFMWDASQPVWAMTHFSRCPTPGTHITLCLKHLYVYGGLNPIMNTASVWRHPTRML